MTMSDVTEPIQLEEEYLFEFHQNSIPSGIKALAEAILDQALQDIITDEGKDAAVYWISIDNYSYPFSFRCICEMLGMNPYAIRNTVQRFVHEQKIRADVQKPCLRCLN
ncbi:MAG: hypothetical protein AB1847_11345 [bacterium]